MLETYPVTIIIGIIMGILAGLGVGGGSILILWLTLVLNMPASTAKGINLLFFLPAALISCVIRWRQGKLTFRKVLPAMVAGVVSALLFSWIGNRISTQALRIPFGILLLFTGIRELFYRPRKAR